LLILAQSAVQMAVAPAAHSILLNLAQLAVQMAVKMAVHSFFHHFPLTIPHASKG